MKIEQIILFPGADLNAELRVLRELEPDLVLAFGALPFFESPQLADTLSCLAPHAVVAGCSTGGEIAADRVHDGSCVVTAIRFERTRVAAASTILGGMCDSCAAGERLAAELAAEDLAAILLFSTGVAVNGSALVRGLRAGVPRYVAISGGLAADAGAFQRTWTLDAHGAADNRVVAVGLYGKDIRAGCGSFAGWEPFGPARQVTRCEDNVLFELDGRRALDIYKSYLGEYARGLPRSGLLFPFEMLGPEQERTGVYRTMIGMNEEDGSLVLAGDIESGSYLTLMHASADKLIGGALLAALEAKDWYGGQADGGGLALLVSCVGRKLVMGDRIDEEVEAVAGILGSGTAIAGFYSNGEISSASSRGGSRLNNQTMTVAWLREE